MPPITDKINLFIAFSEADTEVKDELVEHLGFLRREGQIEVWHKQLIGAGENLEDKQKEALQKAQIILLLISSDYISSDEAFENEVKPAIERHQQGQSKVIPVIVRDCLWKTGMLSQLSPLPVGGKSVNQWQDRDAAFKNIVSEIQKLVARFREASGEAGNGSTIGVPQKPKGITFKKAFIPGIFSVAVGIAVIFIGLRIFSPMKIEETDDSKIIARLQGDWVNPKTTDNFIHRLTFWGDTVGVYSLGENEELYWGGQKLEIINPRKGKVNYKGFSFDLELVMSNFQDTLVESLVAIYSFDTSGIFNIRNSKLYKQETLELIAMQMKNNNDSSKTIDTPMFVLKSDKVVNLNELEITPRMIIDLGEIKSDTSPTRIKNQVVRDAQQRKANYLNNIKVQPQYNLSIPITSDTMNIIQKDKIIDRFIKPNQQTGVKPTVIIKE